MVDIHCHILPDVDDGAENLMQAMEMARMAVESGVTDLVATSHFRGDGDEPGTLERFYQQCCLLKNALKREGIPLRLHLGAEILCVNETVQLAKARQLPTISDTDYVLCEFFFDAPFDYMTEILEVIAGAGYRPVIAHPERYGAIQRDPRRVVQWFRRGFVIQVNKGSALGAFGVRAQETARWLLDMGLVHVIASDAYSPHRRTTDLSRLRRWLRERYPEEYVRLLLTENPGRLVRGQEMAPVR
jgi:protein-tyrosine phosphatase